MTESLAAASQINGYFRAQLSATVMLASPSVNRNEISVHLMRDTIKVLMIMRVITYMYNKFQQNVVGCTDNMISHYSLNCLSFAWIQLSSYIIQCM